MAEPSSTRLNYRRLAAADLDAFHAMLTDEHIRRYLLDGQVLPREAAADLITTSEHLFAAGNVGLWLVSDHDRVVGFCGFRVFDEIEPHPQLLYALLPQATGRGLATEITHALIAYCNAIAFAPVRASVDEVNTASVHILEKTGFVLRSTVTGAFGPMRLYELP